MKFTGAISCLLLSATAAFAAPTPVSAQSTITSYSYETATATPSHLIKNEKAGLDVQANVRVKLTAIINELGIGKAAPDWTGHKGDQPTDKGLPDFSKLIISGDRANAIGKDLQDIVNTLIGKDILDGQILDLDNVKRIVQDVLALLNILGLGFLVPVVSIPFEILDLPAPLVQVVLSDVGHLLASIINGIGLGPEVPFLIRILDGGK